MPEPSSTYQAVAIWEIEEMYAGRWSVRARQEEEEEEEEFILNHARAGHDSQRGGANMLPDKAGFDQKSADTIGYYLYFLPPGGVQVSPRGS